MPIYAKIGTSTWSTNAKKVWAKTSEGWKSATKVFAKTINGWIVMWPKDYPAPNPNDPINIRLGGYSGTVATSPQLFASLDTGGTILKLWGNDGSFLPAEPTDVTGRRMRCATDGSGNGTRFTLSGNDTIDFATTTEENRDAADGYYIFYELTATNSSGSSELYSPPIKVIKRRPAVQTTLVLSGNSGFSNLDILQINAKVRWGWWIRPYLYGSANPAMLKWWRNTSKSPGGTLLKSIYIDNGYDTVAGSYDSTFQISTGTTDIWEIDSQLSVGTNPLTPGEYIIAELVMANSNTDHYNNPVSLYATSGDQPAITAVSVRDERGQTVLDNSFLPDQLGTSTNPSYVFSAPRIISDGFLNFYLTVADASASTSYRLEPRIYNLQNGNYYRSDTGALISSTDWPLVLNTPYSVTLNGTTATVRYRVFINADAFASGPTWDGGKARYQYEFRLSTAATSTGTRRFFTGDIDLGANSISASGDVGAMVEVAPSTVPTLNATPTTGASPLTVTFSGSAVSYPSGYSSYPRSYIIDFGDGSTPETINHSTNTVNPSFSSVTHQYSNTGTYTATLYTIPQGDTSRGTRTRTITIGTAPSTPTGLSATTTRTDGVLLTWNAVSGATSYELWYGVTPSASDTPDFTPGNNTSYLDTGIGSGSSRTYYVRARNSSGVSAWSSGVTGTRAQIANPTITSLSASAPSTTSSQLVTVTVSWTSTNQSSFSCTVTQTGVASYTDYGTTETSTNQTNGGSLFRVYSGASATILLRVYNGSLDSNGFPTGTYAESTISYTPPITTTYGPCEVWYSSTTYECSGTFNRDITTTYYRRKILTGGNWDGSSYDYSESACAPTVTYGSYVFTDGRCGYVTPVSRWYCSINYYSNQLPDEQYIANSDESAVVCNQYRIVCSYNNTGSYPSASTPPTCTTTTTTTTTTSSCTCVYTDYGSYHYSPQCCPTGSARSGSLSGTTSGSCCPTVNKIQRWNCNTFDVNNSSSANWSVCGSVGQCAATSNSAGTRSICYI